MQLLNRNFAYVPTTKIIHYLLSATHAVGKGKAKFFREYGFDDSNVDLLISGLILIAQTEDIVKEIKSSFGVKYIIDGSLESPNGLKLNLRTVWIIEIDEDSPRFVTAYPRSR